MPASACQGFTADDVARECGDLLDGLRATAPLVQCLTNHVASGFTANVLLAVGAAPAMVDIPGEAGAFVAGASGVLVNLGTLNAAQPAAMREAAAAAHDSGTPWVLDPVAVGTLPVRSALAAELVQRRPTLVRGNASEILALAGSGTGGRGVDASVGVDAAHHAAEALAVQTGGAVAVSGPVDLVTDGTGIVRVANGHELLTRVTGAGCALGALMAAFAGLGADPVLAATAGSVVYGVAAENAAKQAGGPGSFASALLDQLAMLTAADVVARARIAVIR
ncbi:hydroxyethylthiazole kinase [Cellulomonas soli]